MDLRNKKNKDGNDVHHVNTPSPCPDEETQPSRGDDASASDTNTTPPPRSKRKKKDGSTKSVSLCRFCKQVFTSPQALGGHMNRHRGEREKEEFQKAEILVHTKGQNFALGYPSGGAAGPSYYQSEDSSGNHYQGGGGAQIANASMMGNMDGGGLQRQAVLINQHQFVGASQMNLNYGATHQQAAQANVYQTNPQHGGSYVHHNNNPGQYQVQGAYAIPHGSSTTGIAHHQSTTGFSTGHNLSQAAGGANTPTVDTIAALGTPTGSNSANPGLRQSSTANQTVAQSSFVDQSGNIIIPRLLYSTGLRPLNPSHFQAATETYNQGSLQDHYTSQASYAGTIVQYNNAAAVGMENHYRAPGVVMLDFEDAQEGDEFGNEGPDSSTIAGTESGHGGNGSSTGRSADARSHH